MLSRVFSRAYSKTKYKSISPQIQTNRRLYSILSKYSKSNLLAIPSQFKSIHTFTANKLLSHPIQHFTPTIQHLTPSNNPQFKIITRSYFPPYYIFKEWENTRSYRSDKWYRYQRSKRRRHKKWLKKTRVKRLVRKTLLENRVKAMREARIKKKEEKLEKMREAEERKVVHELMQKELTETADKKARERFAKHEAYMKEIKEKRAERIRLKTRNEC